MSKPALVFDQSLSFDRFDDLAIDILSDAHSVSFVAARTLIARRLRTLAAEAETAGVLRAAKRFDEAVAQVKVLAKC